MSDEFKEFEGKTGVYIISPDYSPQLRANQKVVVKIGKSSNIRKRLNDYHTCYRESFYTYSIIQTANDYYADKLEKEIHKCLNKYRYEAKEYMARKDGGEWYQAHKGIILKEINKELSKTNIKYKVYNLHKRFFHLK